MTVAGDGGFLAWALPIAFGLVLSGMVLASLRIVRGPSLPDRVVALDTVAALMVAFAGLFAIESGESAFLDIAIALALVAFLATVAFARYAERRGREVREPIEVEPR